MSVGRNGLSVAFAIPRAAGSYFVALPCRMDQNGFGDAPPFAPQPPVPHGYYHSMQMQAFNMAQMQPAFWQPQPGFAPGLPMQPIPPWVTFASAPFPGRGQGMATGAGGPGATFAVDHAHSTELDARHPRDILVGALKNGKELGLSQREVLEHLQNLEKYKGIDWTAYFLENAVLPSGNSDIASRNESRGACVSQGSRATTSPDEPVQKKRRTTQDVRTTIGSGRRRGRQRKALPGNQRSAHSESHSRDDRGLAPSLSPARVPGRRPKRGGTLLEFHNETYIPPSENSSKPIVPLRDPGDDLNRFSAEEKIFFIHYLKWRLRTGRVPSKCFLLAELAKELPHRDVEAWKKHWDDYPTLPDEIYIAARKRAEDEALLSEESDSSTLSPVPSSDDEFSPTSPRLDPSSRPAIVSTSSPVNQKVTEDDLRAMVMYMIEKRHVWGQYRSHYHRWEEFSRRKENMRRRSHSGWNRAAVTYAAQIEQIYNECIAQMSGAGSEEKHEEEATRDLVCPLNEGEEGAALRIPAEPPREPKHSSDTGSTGAAGSSKKSPSKSENMTVKVKREYMKVSDCD
ncbi:hypothetical protein K466DRAFT_595425 [Polyporus arcularius HHB13444]|uniref:Uncharacterized protein n=1 Tax=Polyporus arcularius HHB13444 TaxID=1314778 RepID=A0A5C3PWD5_9APHY|nr:hypothetical protein K466DRAFT_595425 [Polyporus arcularius HHB13444]